MSKGNPLPEDLEKIEELASAIADKHAELRRATMG